MKNLKQLNTESTVAKLDNVNEVLNSDNRIQDKNKELLNQDSASIKNLDSAENEKSDEQN